MENKKVIPAVSILALMLIMVVMVFLIFLPYANVIFWGIFIYILTGPIYNRLISHLNPQKKGYAIKKSIIAALFSIFAVAIIVASFSFVVVKVFGQGKKLLIDIGRTLNTFLDTSVPKTDFDLVELIKSISMGTVDLSRFDFQKEILNLVTLYSEKIISYTTDFVKNIGVFFISLVFLAFSLYFFYLDGETLLLLLKKAVPIDNSNFYQNKRSYK